MSNLSRRTVLRAGVLAGAAATATPIVSARAGAPAILKPLPPECFTDFGTNTEMRWDAGTR